VATNFTALRVKRNIFRRSNVSNVGVITTRRGPSAAGRDASYTVGVDATLLFFNSINLTSYYALTSVPGVTGDTASYRERFDYTDDRYGVSAEHMLIGRDFTPEVGYVRRTDFRRTFGLARFSPRPKNSTHVRKLTWQGSLDYVTDARAITVQNREAKDRVAYTLGQQRKVSGTFGVTIDRVSLPYGDFTARLLSSRFTLTPSARMLVSSLLQHNPASNSLSSSVRLRWEYTGGSELFIVYSDGRNTLSPGFPDVLNRTFAIKATRLIRF
jgi:hypothetical protein